MSDRERGRPNFSNGRGENREVGRSNGNARPGPSYDRFSARGRGAGRFNGRSRGGRGRGGPREKRKERPEFFDLIKTRPESLTTKTRQSTDSSDIFVHLKTNFFKVSTSDKFRVTQYSVIFPREVATPGAKRQLIQQHQSSFGSFLFDGSNILFLLIPLHNDRTEFSSKGRDGQNYRLSIKKTRTIDYRDSNYLQILNLVQRDAMRALNLQRIGRDFYDAEAKVRLIDKFIFRLKIFFF